MSIWRRNWVQLPHWRWMAKKERMVRITENPGCICMSMRHFQRQTSKSFLNRSRHKPNKLNEEKLNWMSRVPGVVVIGSGFNLKSMAILMIMILFIEKKLWSNNCNFHIISLLYIDDYDVLGVFSILEKIN